MLHLNSKHINVINSLIADLHGGQKQPLTFINQLQLSELCVAHIYFYIICSNDVIPLLSCFMLGFPFLSSPLCTVCTRQHYFYLLSSVNANLTLSAEPVQIHRPLFVADMHLFNRGKLREKKDTALLKCAHNETNSN